MSPLLTGRHVCQFQSAVMPAQSKHAVAAFIGSHRPPLQCATRFNMGRPRELAHASPGGSPFQMPTRLADGLGPESDPDDGSPPPCAPSQICSGWSMTTANQLRDWFPRVNLQEGRST